MPTKNTMSPTSNISPCNASIEDSTPNPDGNQSPTQILYQWCVTALSRMDTSECLPSFGPLDLSIAMHRYFNADAVDFNDDIGTALHRYIKSIASLRSINAIDSNDENRKRLQDEAKDEAINAIAKVMDENGLEWGEDHHDSVLEFLGTILDIRFDGDITEASLREHHATTVGVPRKVAIPRRSLLEV